MYSRKDPKTGHYGFWANGDWAIEPRFDYVHSFVRGYAAFEVPNGGSGLIDRNGAYHSIDSIRGFKTAAREKVDFVGFTEFREQINQYAVVGTGSKKRRNWGLIDTSLQYIPLHAAEFSRAFSVQVEGEHLIAIYETKEPFVSRYGLFHIREREWVLLAQYRCIYPSATDPIWVVARGTARRGNPEVAFCNIETGTILSDWYWGAEQFSEGLGAINEDGESSWYFVDHSLRPALGDSRYGNVDRFAHGMAAVSQGSDSGYIDTSGRWRLVLPYETLTAYNRFGWAIANRNDRDWDLDIIDREGQARLTGFETAVFWDGDFPYFETTRKGRLQLWDMQLKLVYEQEE
jgi:hypothetical protein